MKDFNLKTGVTHREAILDYLGHIESLRNVKILYAAESGSRAWGFESPDSDFDVRFLYAHPQSHYLTYNVERKRDVIEAPIVSDSDIPYDVKGWDIRKAIHLFTKSNASVLEWLNSPEVYISGTEPIENLMCLGMTCFDPTALCFHYWRMGRNNAREFLLGKDEVSIKKTLYVLRSFVSTEWIRHMRSLPPINFEYLLTRAAVFSKDVMGIYDEACGLIRTKQITFELSTVTPDPALASYIDKSLEVNDKEFKSLINKDLRQGKWDDSLNRIFRESIDWE